MTELGFDAQAMAVNSRAYWDARFGSGDWAARGGYSQTALFAEAQVARLGIDAGFDGLLCDFGCGAGDAFPVYRRAFPRAQLVGVDFSQSAVDLCRERHGELARFHGGDAAAVPPADIIICSNVLEHVPDDAEIVAQLLARCGRLFVIVPYREKHLIAEHLRAYDAASFQSFHPARRDVFASHGWSEFGRQLWVDVHLKNLARVLLGRPTRRRQLQVLFEFRGRR